MTDYVKSTNFASKDALAIGNPLKIVKGTEIDAEFNNIATAVATKADLASPMLTGTPAAPTASAGTNTTQIATTAFVAGAIAADKVDTALTGTPTAPTAAVNTNTTQVATTAFVVAQIADDAPTKTGTGASGTWGISITGSAASAATVSSPTVSAGTLYQVSSLYIQNSTNSSTSYVMQGQLKIYASGSVRVLWELYDQLGNGVGVTGRIYKNGSAIGTERTTTSTSSVSYTDDISVSVGDVIQLYFRANGTIPGAQAAGTILGVGTAANTLWPIAIGSR